MTATTVRVDDPAVKAELDRLQAEIALHRGKKPSHTALLAEMLEFIRQHESQFLGGGESRPFTNAEIRRLRRYRARTGVHVSARDLEDALYGGDRP